MALCLGAKLNEQEIIKVSNFLPDQDYLTLFNIVNNESVFPWYFLSSVSGTEYKSDEKDNQFGFSHILYDKSKKTMSNYLDSFRIIEPYIESHFNLNIKDIFRYRLGMNLKISNNSITHSPHRDFDFDHLTFLYYLNSSDGPTIFYDNDINKKIEIFPEKNCGVLFNGILFHSSSTPSKNVKRITLNLNFLA